MNYVLNKLISCMSAVEKCMYPLKYVMLEISITLYKYFTYLLQFKKLSHSLVLPKYSSIYYSVSSTFLLNTLVRL